MSPREVFRFDCPCCGKEVEVNTRSGRAKAVNFAESKQGQSFDGLVRDAQSDDKRLGDLFEDAKGLHSDNEERLMGLFEKAKQKTAKDKDRDQKPPGPFDLD